MAISSCTISGVNLNVFYDAHSTYSPPPTGLQELDRNSNAVKENWQNVVLLQRNISIVLQSIGIDGAFNIPYTPRIFELNCTTSRDLGKSILSENTQYCFSAV